MRLPRDLSGGELVSALRRLGYQVTRQTGSHIRLTTWEGGEHHVTVPHHANVTKGVVSTILREVGDHFQIERDDLLDRLFTD